VHQQPETPDDPETGANREASDVQGRIRGMNDTTRKRHDPLRRRNDVRDDDPHPVIEGVSIVREPRSSVADRNEALPERPAPVREQDDRAPIDVRHPHQWQCGGLRRIADGRHEARRS